MFRKKSQYLVLTDRHLVRFKSQSRASEVFPSIPASLGRSNTMRHSRMSSSSSSIHEMQASTESHPGLLLNRIVAVYKLEDGRPYFSIDIAHLDEETNHASALTLQLNDPRESELWLTKIRAAAIEARLTDPLPFTRQAVEYVARALEQERDYDPNHFRMFRVVQRASKTAGRSSSDDLSKLNSNICYLVIGVHKIHLVPLPRLSKTASSTSLSDLVGASHGILCLTSINLQSFDDAFQLTFRKPFQQYTNMYLASSSVTDIAVWIRHAADFLRPEWLEQPFTWNVPTSLDNELLPIATNTDENHYFDRTLIAYCAAYDVDTSNIRYTVNPHCEDAPGFELMPPADLRRTKYTVLELLAIMRALRYNESFHSISFHNISLDVLHGLRDQHGFDHVATTTRSGGPLGVRTQEHAWLLIQEIQALALKSKRLRRMDFSYSLSRKPRDGDTVRDPGCGICEALFPLCGKQLTNVDWIALNGITLADVDVDYLFAAAVEPSCHFRAIDVGKCSLTDRSMHTVLQAMLHQAETMESIDISGNLARIDPDNLVGLINRYGYIRKVNMSSMQRTSGPQPLITADALLGWKLNDLHLSYTTMNEQSVNALATYLAHPQSKTLRVLGLQHCQLSGRDVAVLLRAMIEKPGRSRKLHLFLCENRLEQQCDLLIDAIEHSVTPDCMTMQMIEYKTEVTFQRLIEAMTKNTTLKVLDLSKASLPYDASEETCEALKKMFADNSTLEELNISGEHAHLETAAYGIGLNHALTGLKRNSSLRVLRIEYQKLGLQGASTLASVLESNTTLQEVYCENNDITLQAFTVIVHSLEHNSTLLYLPTLENDRAWALKKITGEIEDIQRLNSNSMPSSTKTTVSKTLSRAMTGQRSFSNRSIEKPIPISGYTEKEAQTAIASLAQEWDREVARLQSYLQRNYNLLHGIPDIGHYDDENGRPGTSFRTTSDEITPRAELNVQLGFETRNDLMELQRGARGGKVFDEGLIDLGDSGDEIDHALTMVKDLKV